MPKIKVNNIYLNYEIRGSGPKVLFIHGIGADMKNPLGLSNSPMMEHFTVLSFDSRGLGKSDSPFEGCTIADLAKDAADLAKAVGWKKYHVFGVSMGGMVAQELAINYPEVLDKLVLAVTHSGGNNNVPILVDRILDLTPLEMLKAADIRQDEKWAAEHPEMITRMKMQTENMRKAFDQNTDYKRGFMHQAEAVINHDTTSRLNQIKAKTLVFNGKYDGGIPLSAVEIMTKGIRHCTPVLLEHGHGSWFFDPSVWKIIIEYLGNKK